MSVHGRARAVGLVVVGVILATLVGSTQTPVGAQESYQRISGEGSSWAANAIDAMRVNVKQFGITVDYNPSGSTSGRKNFLNGTVDFAASDIPFQFEPEDGSAPENPAPGSYAYIPVTAGGTAFMYNLRINGQQVTNLRLSGENVAKIFTLVITKWNDPALQADNPGIVLPDRDIVPVVRSDGSGSTAQFTQWMIAKHGGIWNDYCSRSGRAPACGFTSQYPTVGGTKMIAQAGDVGIAGYVSQGFAEGAIGYVNYSYALGVQFPVAKVLNAAGFYTEPTPDNVAVSLLQARINDGRRQSGGLPDAAARWRLQRRRPPQLPAVVVFVLHPADEDRRPVQRRERPHARRVRVLRDVSGPTVLGIARLLADAVQPGRGQLQPDPQDPRRGREEPQQRRLQEPDVLARWHQRPRQRGGTAAGMRPAGPDDVPDGYRRPEQRSDRDRSGARRTDRWHDRRR